MVLTLIEVKVKEDLFLEESSIIKAVVVVVDFPTTIMASFTTKTTVIAITGS